MSTHRRYLLPPDSYISFELTQFGPWCYVTVLNNKRYLNAYQLGSEPTLVRKVEDVDAIASHEGVFGYFHNNKVVIWTTSGEVSYEAPYLVSFLHSQMLLDISPYQVRLFPLSEFIAYHTQRKGYMFIELFYQ